MTHLGLQQTAFKEDQSLPSKLPNQLPQAHSQILISVFLPISLPVFSLPSLLLRQTLLEATYDIRIRKVPLTEPSLRNNTESLPEHAKELRGVSDDHNSLLDSRTSDFGRAIDQGRGVELAGTRDTEQGGSRFRIGSGMAKSEV